MSKKLTLAIPDNIDLDKLGDKVVIKLKRNDKGALTLVGVEGEKNEDKEDKEKENEEEQEEEGNDEEEKGKTQKVGIEEAINDDFSKYKGEKEEEAKAREKEEKEKEAEGSK